MESVKNRRMRLHFDTVHFFLSGEDVIETVHRLLPYTAHTHITDSRVTEKGFELVSLGEGELDIVSYLRAMWNEGWRDYITVEVSRMVWSRNDYAPEPVASLSMRNLLNAFSEAGIERG